ncbi:MAG: deaminase [Terriglobales bacterium]
MVIGLTGANGSGKTTLANFLGTKGFYYHSLSDEIRAELEASGIAPTRENLIERGNALRRRFGPGVLAARTLQRLQADRNYVVDSIRHPKEVETLRSLPRFFLLHVDAPLEVRYRRAVERGDPRTPKSFEEFVALEHRERGGADAEGQNLDACAALADATVSNDGAVEPFLARAEQHIIPWMRDEPRPGWDEYFMRIARIVALRSNCIKRKVAAVIVKDRRIISTGYNGTPRGITNCNQGGCPRCNALAASGTRLDECLCSHGEENAIVQAAYHGIAIKGSVLYTTFSPCLQCTKMIVNGGVVEVVYNAAYPLGDGALRMLKEAAVQYKQIEVT